MWKEDTHNLELDNTWWFSNGNWRGKLCNRIGFDGGSLCAAHDKGEEIRTMILGFSGMLHKFLILQFLPAFWTTSPGTAAYICYPSPAKRWIRKKVASPNRVPHKFDVLFKAKREKPHANENVCTAECAQVVRVSISFPPLTFSEKIFEVPTGLMLGIL